jgi:RNA polymerase sigma-70 factor (ECF subfamily)
MRTLSGRSRSEAPRRGDDASSLDDVRAVAPASRATQLAVEVKSLVAGGDREAAHERFAELVEQQQRRAVRIAYHYLRDAHDADEAVQDAFIKVFTHIATYREQWPFEVWFTRILINACLDLRKARARRLRWTVPATTAEERPALEPRAPQPTPEDRILSGERQTRISAAVDRLPDRQRTVFTLYHIAEMSTRDVGNSLGLSEATVRVHLFRAVRKLRALLEPARAEA